MRMYPTRVPFEWKVNQWYVYCIIVSVVAKWSSGMKLHESLLKQPIFPLVRIANAWEIEQHRYAFKHHLCNYNGFLTKCHSCSLSSCMSVISINQYKSVLSHLTCKCISHLNYANESAQYTPRSQWWCALVAWSWARYFYLVIALWSTTIEFIAFCSTTLKFAPLTATAFQCTALWIALNKLWFVDMALVLLFTFLWTSILYATATLASCNHHSVHFALLNDAILEKGCCCTAKVIKVFFMLLPAVVTRAVLCNRASTWINSIPFYCIWAHVIITTNTIIIFVDKCDFSRASSHDIAGMVAFRENDSMFM